MGCCSHRCLLPFAFCLRLGAARASAALTDTVNDFAHVIDEASRAELDRRIRALKETTGDVLIVATVPTYQPYGSIEEYAVKMFENGGRGIGEKGKDNGLLLLVAVNDRKVKIEVGYDLEGMIPDGFAGQTIREAIAPAFRAAAATGRDCSTRRRGSSTGSPSSGTSRFRTSPWCARPGARGRRARIPWPTDLLVIVHCIILSRGNRRRRRRYWGGGPWSNWNGGVGPFGGGGFGGGGFGGFGGGGGGSGGGGFGGFGGGRSGGGGASGGW